MRRKQSLVCITLTLSCLIFILGCSVTGSDVDNAKNRVKEVLAGLLQENANNDEQMQVSVSKWYSGTRITPDIGVALYDFEAWAKKAGIFPTITAFSVEGAIKTEEQGTATVMVYGTINGIPFEMKVPKGRKISWIKMPKVEK